MRRLDLFNNSDFSRGCSRGKEMAWQICRFVFFSHSLPLPSRFKVMVLRRFGAKIGAGVVIRGRVNITFPWRFSCGNHVWIGEEVIILSLAKVSIGSNVCLSQRAFLCTGSHDYRRAGFDLITKPIVIADGSWVGAQVFVAPGVDIHENTVCAAGSVVIKSAGPNELIAGNPAVAIRKLDLPQGN